MSAGSSTDVQFQSSDGDLGDYRRFSVAALITLILGLLSVLALVTPLLWIIPAAGCIVGLATIWTIDRSDDPITGRTLAVIGVALSILLGVAAPTRSISRQIWLKGRAEQFAQEWFKLLAAGDQFRSHQLTKHVGGRLPLDDNLESKYSSMPGLSDSFTEDYLSNSAVSDLLKYRDKVTVEHIDTSVTEQPAKDAFRLRYRILPDEATGGRPSRLTLYTERAIGPTGREEWVIISISGDQLPS